MTLVLTRLYSAMMIVYRERIMTITLRNTKGQALTFNELDGNFTDLDSRILSQAQIEGFIDSLSLIHI